MEETAGEALAALARIPLFEGLDRADIRAERLGGLTNRNYRIDCPAGRFVLRIAGEGTGEYIDRAAEAHDARIAADAGVNAEVLFFDTADGTMLTRYIDGALTMTAETFRDLDRVRRAGVAFRRLHDCGRPFAKRFDPFAKVDEYLALIDKLGARVPDGYDEVLAETDEVRAALARHPVALAPCHCDPLAENFLDTGARTYIIDYEYAGNNDPLWDLGDLSVEAEFGPAQDAALLEAYFDGPAPEAEAARMVMHKAVCDVLWTLWGVLQVANDNPAEDFWAYAVNRLNRCRGLMKTPEFARALAVLQGG